MKAFITIPFVLALAVTSADAQTTGQNREKPAVARARATHAEHAEHLFDHREPAVERLAIKRPRRRNHRDGVARAKPGERAHVGAG